MAAPGNSYPAVALDQDGKVVDSMAAIQFTDDSDQPGTGGGGGGQPLATLFVTGAIPSQCAAALITGGGSTSGQIAAGAQIAGVTGMGDTVAALDQDAYSLAGIVASAADSFDIRLEVDVFSADGLNVATAAGQVTLPNPVTDLASAGSFADAGLTWTVVSGTDLTIVGNALVTTAGGLYFQTVSVIGNWD